MNISKKKMLLWGAIVALGALVIAVGVIACVLSGPEESPKEQDDSVRYAQKVLTPKISAAFTEVDNSDEELPAFLKVLDTTQTFKVHSVKTDDSGNMEVKLTVKAPDLAWVFEDLKTSTASTEEEMNAAIERSIAKAPRRSETVTVSFYNNEGEWEPLITDSLFNAYYGGVLELWEELLGGGLGA